MFIPVQNVFRVVIFVFFGVVLSFLPPLAAKGRDTQLLQSDDISKVMQQIFRQHIDKKEISGEILKHSFRYYIDQFDPNKIYLLESEIEPFLYPSSNAMRHYISQYKQDDFSAYERMNTIFARAIERARAWRAEFEANQESLFRGRGGGGRGSYGTFASSPKELKKRIDGHLVRYIQRQKRQFGRAAVMQSKNIVLAKYENKMRYRENEYLFQNKKGQPLSKTEHEHYFALHVLKSLAQSLDAHTAFFDHAEAYDMRVRLEKGYEGIGIVFQEGLGGAAVVGLVPGGPAEKNGLIKANDLLIRINGRSVEKEPFQRIMRMIRGKEGSYVTLLLKRKGSGDKDTVIRVKLKREALVAKGDRIEVGSERFGEGIIGKITLDSFYQNSNGVSSEKDVHDAILNLRKKGKLRGLVLDLRRNSGGYLSQAVKVAGLFITNGVVVVSKYSDGKEKFYRDLASTKSYDGPLVILTSKLTASAAEIVAQSLQDYGVAVIVGDEQTYGKGSIQSQTVTNGDSHAFFKVTVGEYYTVSGRTPQLHGVKADIVVPSAFSQENIGEEYLDYPITAVDNIKPSYQDTLQDVKPSSKRWYMKYYIPTIQHKKYIWQEMIPTLKKNSTYRLSNNYDFQHFLEEIGAKPAAVIQKSYEKGHAPSSEPKDVGSNDLQMEEAVNIVKDMILIQTDVDRQTLGKRDYEKIK